MTADTAAGPSPSIPETHTVTDTLGRQSKLCRKCGEQKPMAAFNVYIRNRGGYRASCKACRSTQQKGRYYSTPRPDAVMGTGVSHPLDLAVIDTLGRSEKPCMRCGEVKPIPAFSPARANRGGYRHECKLCRTQAQQARKKSPRHQAYLEAYRKGVAWRRPNGQATTKREQYLKANYGLTEVEFVAMFEAQGRRCALCRGDDPRNRYGRWRVDHCHESGRVRGLLCNSCNVALGMLGDTPEALRRALGYVVGEPTP